MQMLRASASPRDEKPIAIPIPIPTNHYHEPPVLPPASGCLRPPTDIYLSAASGTAVGCRNEAGAFITRNELKKGDQVRNDRVRCERKASGGVREIIIIFLFIAALPSHAMSWGWIGHRAAAKIAEDHLTPRARAAVADLLGPGVRLADVATWADEQQEIPQSAPWHSVNVPLNESRYASRFCSPRGCVVSKIGEFARVLRNPAAGKAEKQRALKFLVHFIADLHQPLHVGDNGTRGGNLLQVRFYGEGSNLHKVWDYQIMERHTKNLGVWLWDLTFEANPKRVAEWSKGTPEEWATESLNLAKSAYRLPGSQAWILPGTNLGTRYSGASLPGIRKQLAKAAIRIAWVLNGIFSQ